MEVIFKWVVLGLILAGVAAAIRQYRQVNRERKEAIEAMDRRMNEWWPVGERVSSRRAPLRSVK